MAELVRQNPDNKLAMDYLRAYELIYRSYRYNQALFKQHQP